MKKYKILIILFICFFSCCYAQTKNEKEEKIEQQQFPKTATPSLNIIKQFEKKIKLYKETDSNKVSYEAKFKYKKQKYSIEFSKEGTLEDIEITVKNKKIDRRILNKINRFLEKNYSKHKLKKTQKQFVFKHKQSQEEFIKATLNGDFKQNPNLEIIAEIKTGNNYLLKEFLFNSEGIHISTKTVSTTSYGHVLY